MKGSLKMLAAGTVVMGLLWVGSVQAQPNQGPGSGGAGGPGRGGPPPEAIAACKDKSAGDQCEFERRDGGKVEGTCALPPRGGELSCRPQGPPPGGPGQGGNGGGPGNGGPPR